MIRSEIKGTNKHHPTEPGEAGVATGCAFVNRSWGRELPLLAAELDRVNGPAAALWVVMQPT
jgi:hypothetical protein